MFPKPPSNLIRREPGGLERRLRYSTVVGPKTGERKMEGEIRACQSLTAINASWFPEVPACLPCTVLYCTGPSASWRDKHWVFPLASSWWDEYYCSPSSENLNGTECCFFVMGRISQDRFTPGDIHNSNLGAVLLIKWQWNCCSATRPGVDQCGSILRWTGSPSSRVFPIRDGNESNKIGRLSVRH